MTDVEKKYYIDTLAANMDRANRRLWVLIILLSVLFIGSNVWWIAYESQFRDVSITQEVEQDADNGTNNFTGGDYYGEAES